MATRRAAYVSSFLEGALLHTDKHDLYMIHFSCVCKSTVNMFRIMPGFDYGAWSAVMMTELSTGRMDPALSGRVGSGQDFAGFWRVGLGQHFGLF